MAIISVSSMGDCELIDESCKNTQSSDNVDKMGYQLLLSEKKYKRRRNLRPGTKLEYRSGC